SSGLPQTGHLVTIFFIFTSAVNLIINNINIILNFVNREINNIENIFLRHLAMVILNVNLATF
ncbi:MAG: hypothetical protein ACP5GW_03505, partial [Caldisericaceae bacterium]